VNVNVGAFTVPMIVLELLSRKISYWAGALLPVPPAAGHDTLTLVHEAADPVTLVGAVAAINAPAVAKRNTKEERKKYILRIQLDRTHDSFMPSL
jgi:hypothetical protein